MIYFYFKRFCDIFFSVAAIVICSPLLLLISLLIFIFDNGPIIYKQERLGKKIFVIYKFRTLPVNTMNISSDKLDVKRITKIGNILRRTNFDELPQLVNILRGDMSFVGPRPCLASQKELINLRIKKNIFFLRPGLTGLAQVNSFENMSIETKVFFDEVYLNEISFRKDFSILLRTAIYLLKSPPKY